MNGRGEARESFSPYYSHFLPYLFDKMRIKQYSFAEMAWQEKLLLQIS